MYFILLLFSLPDLDEMVEGMMVKMYAEGPLGGFEFKCTICDKVQKKKQHMIAHVETHISGFSHPCSICGKPFKTRGSRDKHRYVYHKNDLTLSNW